MKPVKTLREKNMAERSISQRGIYMLKRFCYVFSEFTFPCEANPFRLNSRYE